MPDAVAILGGHPTGRQAEALKMANPRHFKTIPAARTGVSLSLLSGIASEWTMLEKNFVVSIASATFAAL